jgi:hypothetical protein
MLSSDWVRVYDNVIDPVFCAELRALVDNHGRRYEEGYRNCQEFQFPDAGLPLSMALFERLRPIMRGALNVYRAQVKHESILNFCSQVERGTIVRYDPNGDHFAIHADNWNSGSSLRQVSFILYLNDVQEGGETVFPTHDMKVAPREGRALMFPASFIFPHLSDPPKSNPKYAIVTWFCFESSGGHYGTVNL